MTHPRFRFASGLLWTLLVCAATTILGDYLFFQRNWAGAAIGIYCAALLIALLVRRQAVRRNGKALAAAAAAAIFAGTMIFDMNMLAWLMFWIAASMATLLPGDMTNYLRNFRFEPRYNSEGIGVTLLQIGALVMQGLVVFSVLSLIGG